MSEGCGKGTLDVVREVEGYQHKAMYSKSPI